MSILNYYQVRGLSKPMNSDDTPTKRIKLPKPQYTRKVDGTPSDAGLTHDLDGQDFLDLSLAAADQAGASLNAQKRIRAILENDLGISVGWL